MFQTTPAAGCMKWSSTASGASVVPDVQTRPYVYAGRLVRLQFIWTIPDNEVVTLFACRSFDKCPHVRADVRGRVDGGSTGPCLTSGEASWHVESATASTQRDDVSARACRMLRWTSQPTRFTSACGERSAPMTQPDAHVMMPG